MANTELMMLSENQLDMVGRTADLPSGYKGKPGNVILAYEYGRRNNLSLLEVMQKISFIQGKPTWSAEAMRARLNQSGYIVPPISYKWNDEHTACRVSATLKSDKRVLEGPEVSMTMAQKDGWTKNSKWQTIPEQMLMNRATTFFVRYYFPDILDGIISGDEAEDIAAINGTLEYEDKTAPAPAPAPAEPEQPKQPSPKMRLWNAVLEQVEGDEAKAAEICKAVVGGQTVTEDNIGGMIIEASKIIADSKIKTEPEEVVAQTEGEGN